MTSYSTRRAGGGPPVHRLAPAAPALPLGGAAQAAARTEPPPVLAAATQQASAPGSGTGSGKVQNRLPGAENHQGRAWTVAMPAGMELLNANDRGHWARRHTVGGEIKKAAWACALGAKVPPVERAHIVVEYQPPPGKRRRDADNLFASAKPAIDGLVAAKVLRDDSSAYVAGATLRIGEPYPLGRLVLHIYEITEDGNHG